MRLYKEDPQKAQLRREERIRLTQIVSLFEFFRQLFHLFHELLIERLLLCSLFSVFLTLQGAVRTEHRHMNVNYYVDLQQSQFLCCETRRACDISVILCRFILGLHGICIVVVLLQRRRALEVYLMCLSSKSR